MSWEALTHEPVLPLSWTYADSMTLKAWRWRDGEGILAFCLYHSDCVLVSNTGHAQSGPEEKEWLYQHLITLKPEEPWRLYHSHHRIWKEAWHLMGLITAPITVFGSFAAPQNSLLVNGVVCVHSKPAKAFSAPSRDLALLDSAQGFAPESRTQAWKTPGTILALSSVPGALTHAALHVGIPSSL